MRIIRGSGGAVAYPTRHWRNCSFSILTRICNRSGELIARRTRPTPNCPSAQDGHPKANASTPIQRWALIDPRPSPPACAATAWQRNGSSMRRQTATSSRPGAKSNWLRLGQKATSTVSTMSPSARMNEPHNWFGQRAHGSSSCRPKAQTRTSLLGIYLKNCLPANDRDGLLQTQGNVATTDRAKL